MSAPVGNQNAIGNSGGKTLNDRKLAADIRKLALTKIKKILKGEDSDFQRQILLRLASSVLPRLKETEENGNPLKILYFDPAFAPTNKQTTDSTNSANQNVRQEV
jgi:hypothetical protein